MDKILHVFHFVVDLNFTFGMYPVSLLEGLREIFEERSENVC